MSSESCINTEQNNLGEKSEKNKNAKSKKSGRLELKTPKGTRDYGGLEMTARRWVFGVIKDIFNMHGAVEIETPVFELKHILTDKYGEDSKLIYDLEDQGGEILSLRYDLTVPFARYVAMNKISNIKRYHIARVYRRDNPVMTKGRYREFYQCDFDIAGVYDPMVTDAECIQVIHQVLTKLNIGNFQIKINHRKILDGLFDACGVPKEKFKPICSAIDKLDKISWDEVKKEMVEVKGLDESVADLIGEYVQLQGGKELLNKLIEDPNLKNSKAAQAGISDIIELLDFASCLDCDQNIIVDMGLARGLDYYTGLIYEAILLNTEGVGTVAAGGRYDELVGVFHPKNNSVPCVGVSFGIERLFTVYEKQQKASGKLRATETEVYVASPGKGMILERLRLLAHLQEHKIKCETSYRTNPKLLKQLQYAEENAIPLVILIGESEIAEGIVKIRVTTTREEEVVPRDKVVDVNSYVLRVAVSDAPNHAIFIGITEILKVL